MIPKKRVVTYSHDVMVGKIVYEKVDTSSSIKE